MKDKIFVLIQLQECDNRIARILQAKEQAPLKIQKLENELRAMETEFKADEDQLEALKKDRRQLEREIQELDGKIEKKVTPLLDQLQSPCLLPDGRRALVVGHKEGVQDVYLLERICGICGFIHSTCYCQAVEKAAGDGIVIRAAGDSRSLAGLIRDWAGIGFAAERPAGRAPAPAAEPASRGKPSRTRTTRSWTTTGRRSKGV